MSSILDKRRAGVLLHITSLPSTLGFGSMGRHAYRFVDFLRECGLSVWQILPIHPLHRVPLRTPHRDCLSPYQPMSAFAGNPMLINLRKLIDRDWAPRVSLPIYNRDQLVDAVKYRHSFLKNSYSYFSKHSSSEDKHNFCIFMDKNKEWLEDYALFCVFKDIYKDVAWWGWERKGFRNHKSEAMKQASEKFLQQVNEYYFEQFVFFTQWDELKTYANDNGIYLFGDMPFFVSGDSVDVWAHRDYFLLDERGKLEFTSGVCKSNFVYPYQEQFYDYPLYHWDNMKKTEFTWWCDRFMNLDRLFDIARLTYFQGFEKCLKVPCTGSKPMSRSEGICYPTPTGSLFAKINQHTHIPMVTDVPAPPNGNKLHEQLNLYSSKVLQLAFCGEDAIRSKNCHLLHKHLPSDVFYTGTHDSNTILGWLKELQINNSDKLKHICDYFDIQPLPELFIKATFRSVAKLAVIPMQDILELDESCRMNIPETLSFNNWRWHFEWSQLTYETENKLKEWVTKYDRD